MSRVHRSPICSKERATGQAASVNVVLCTCSASFSSGVIPSAPAFRQAARYDKALVGVLSPA
jgi:hypothetical protein